LRFNLLEQIKTTLLLITHAVNPPGNR